jgi:DNA primase small subunit
MNHATLEYLKFLFGSYYRNGTLLTPPALEQREWGFLNFSVDSEVRMRRHMAFTSLREVSDYLRTMVPAHVFYSTAYYAFPAAGTMNEKGWCGADLIFDLDADHIARGSYAQMLERVKEETIKLITMLTGELGFARRDIDVVFSGGRGYHVHVRDIGVREWSSHERRELVDYVCGIGLDPDMMLVSSSGGTGWPERYRNALVAELVSLKGMERAQAVASLTGLDGIGKKSAEIFLDSIDAYIAMLMTPGEQIASKNRVFRALAAMRYEGIRDRIRDQAALTDEPVTTDIKRLIRMPTSLHGGSGFRVIPLRFSELAEFDPLTDAVVFGDGEVRVNIPQSIPYPVPILGNTYRLETGITRVPEALAVFLCCRGIAEYAGG